MQVLEERNGSDSELLVFAMTLINKVKKTSPVMLRFPEGMVSDMGDVSAILWLG